MSRFKTIDQLAVTGRRVLLRVDLNVPMAAGRVTDATRITRILPTLTELIDRSGRTRAQAVRKPHSSSQANSECSSCVTRGTPL